MAQMYTDVNQEPYFTFRAIHSTVYIPINPQEDYYADRQVKRNQHQLRRMRKR